jgi:hypothetical protein
MSLVWMPVLVTSEQQDDVDFDDISGLSSVLFRI